MPEMTRAQYERWRAEVAAPVFHKHYDRLAPDFGRASREEAPPLDLHPPAGRHWIATCEAAMRELYLTRFSDYRRYLGHIPAEAPDAC